MALTEREKLNLEYRLSLIGAKSSYLLKKPRDPKLYKLLRDIERAGKKLDGYDVGFCDSYAAAMIPAGVPCDAVAYTYYQGDLLRPSHSQKAVDLYASDIYPKELLECHNANRVDIEEDYFAGTDDLHTMLCETQIDHIDYEKHYVYVNLCAIGDEKMSEYLSCIMDAVQPSFLKDKQLRIACSDRETANMYSLPFLKIDHP